jgi:hypothetical protein
MRQPPKQMTPLQTVSVWLLIVASLLGVAGVYWLGAILTFASIITGLVNIWQTREQ